MHGITVDCKTHIIKEVDNALPMPDHPPFDEPEGLDLVEAAKKLKEIDKLEKRIKALEDYTHR